MKNIYFINAIKLIAVTLLSMPASSLLYAQTVKVEGAWVRTTVEGQKGTGGFMKLTADQDLQLVGLRSSVAGLSEVHEMKMNGDVMTMRAIPGGLSLPAGKAVELKPGGMHLMLMDLKQALPKDSLVPLTLLLKDKAGKDIQVDLKVPVSARAPAATAGAAPGAAPSGAAPGAEASPPAHKH